MHTYLDTATLFFAVVELFSLLTAMCNNVCSPTALPSELPVEIFIFCQSDKGEKWYLRVVLVCISLVISR